MVPHDALLNALRDLGYTFKRQTDRVAIYRKRGGTDRITLRRRKFHTPEATESILSQAGMAEEDIARFIAQYSTSRALH